MLQCSTPIHRTSRFTITTKLTSETAYVIVAQLCLEFTARLVDRWQELESGAGMVVPQTLPEALRLAADLAEQKQRLSEELAIAAPKAEFVDRYVKATGSMTFRQVAKLLNAKARVRYVPH
jgi:phage regulator Rha-like protein